MKNLVIRYSMSRPGAEAERSITLPPIPPEWTDDILDGDRPEALGNLLNALAQLQGYEAAELLSVSAEVPPGVVLAMRTGPPVRTTMPDWGRSGR